MRGNFFNYQQEMIDQNEKTNKKIIFEQFMEQYFGWTGGYNGGEEENLASYSLSTKC